MARGGEGKVVNVLEGEEKGGSESSSSPGRGGVCKRAFRRATVIRTSTAERINLRVVYERCLLSRMSRIMKKIAIRAKNTISAVSVRILTPR